MFKKYGLRKGGHKSPRAAPPPPSKKGVLNFADSFKIFRFIGDKLNIKILIASMRKFSDSEIMYGKAET